MSAIKGKNTKPEILVRKALHAAGFRFRLHEKKLPGKPDIVLPQYKTVIFVHGCFWHGHDGCDKFKWPKTRGRFWKNKIGGNQKRDTANKILLLSANWRVATIWECALGEFNERPRANVIRKMIKLLNGTRRQFVLGNQRHA